MIMSGDTSRQEQPVFGNFRQTVSSLPRETSGATGTERTAAVENIVRPTKRRTFQPSHNISGGFLNICTRVDNVLDGFLYGIRNRLWGYWRGMYTKRLTKRHDQKLWKLGWLALVRVSENYVMRLRKTKKKITKCARQNSYILLH